MGSQAKPSKKKVSTGKPCTSEPCIEEIQSLKAQLLGLWKEKLSLHKEAKRLQACLDRREDTIKSLEEENEKLRLQVFSKSSLPSTSQQGHHGHEQEEGEGEKQERYKYEEEKGVVASQYTLDIQHKYASDEELVDGSKSDPIRLKLKLAKKKKNGKERKKKTRTKKEGAKKESRRKEKEKAVFNLDISDVEVEPREEDQHAKCNGSRCPSLSSPGYCPPTLGTKRGREDEYAGGELTAEGTGEVNPHRSTRKRRRLIIED
ncbi:hypothetical protein AA313_de0203442 [Arthrobotrys entomopaga]|nr:hypothetical protein AA313_de0203442 [Arthrobotrys entomopaga]